MIIDNIKSRLSLYKSIKLHLQGSNHLVIILFIIKILLIFSGIMSPYFFKILIDDVIIARKLNYIIWVCIGYISIYIFEFFIFSVQRSISNKLFNRFLFNIKYALFNKSIHAPMSFHDSYSSADLKIRIDTDADKFENLIKEYIIDYLYVWLFSITLSVILLVLNWKLAAISFLTIPLSFWLTKFFGGLAGKTQEDFRNRYGSYEEWLKENIHSWREIKSFCIQNKQERKFIKIWQVLNKIFFKQEIIVIAYNCLIILKDFFISRMSLYLIGGILIFNGDLTIGMFFIFLKYFEQFVGNIGKINNYDMQLKVSMPNISRVMEILECPTTKLIKKSNIVIRGNIEFKNVFFKYKSSKQNVLEDISFKINTNDKIAIVGKSGCGKTTLIKLLLNLHQKDQGEVLVDNQKIEEISTRDLHKNIGVVMQDSILFNLTIKENLLLANPRATDAEIQNACEEACIDSFINQLPEKYNTLIGEKGLKLSGGQRQRLAIARVLLNKPNIIIFDEATSALDHESEKLIHKSIENISSNKTILIIAHRLSSVLTADKIIVMDNGKICGFGVHNELIKDNIYYKSLFNPQYKEVI